MIPIMPVVTRKRGQALLPFLVDIEVIPFLRKGGQGPDWLDGAHRADGGGQDGRALARGSAHPAPWLVEAFGGKDQQAAG
jgi:hypothetical protein